MNINLLCWHSHLDSPSPSWLTWWKPNQGPSSNSGQVWRNCILKDPQKGPLICPGVSHKMWCNKQLALFGIVMDCRYLSQYARGHYPHWYRMNVQVWSIYHSGKKGTYHLFPKFDGCMPIFRILAWVYHPCFTKPNIIFLLIYHIAFRIPKTCKKQLFHDTPIIFTWYYWWKKSCTSW